MAKLCFKQNGIIKKYELKSEADKPRLSVHDNNTTQYLKLRRGTKNNELSVRIEGIPYHVETKTITNLDALSFSQLYTTDGNTNHYGGISAWPIYTDDKTLLGMIAVACAESDGSPYVSLDFSSPKIYQQIGFDFKPGKYTKMICKLATFWAASPRGSIPTTSLVKDKLLTSNVITPDNTITTESTALKNIKTSRLGGVSAASTTDYSSLSGVIQLLNVERTDLYTDHYNIILLVEIDNKNGSANNQLPRFTFDWTYANPPAITYSGAFFTEYLGPYWVATYIEFPENGLIGLSPETVLSMWVNVLGSSYQIQAPTFS